MKSIFITGTDTDIGKTLVSAALGLAISKSSNKKVSYYKPIQTGVLNDRDSKTIEDLTLGKIKVESESYLLNDPISPDRASIIEQKEIVLSKIEQDYLSIRSEVCIVEGAGGIQVPINQNERISDIPKKFSIPILIVSSTKLGTINHTILTVEAARSLGLEIAGIVLSGSEDPGLAQLLEFQTKVKVVGEIPSLHKIDYDILRDNAESWFFKDFLNKFDNHPQDQNLWYPFTQHKLQSNHKLITHAKDQYLFSKEGDKIYDAISSWWVNLHGHCNEKISASIHKQSKKLEHSILTGVTHETAIELGQSLIDLVNTNGSHFSRVFFSDNGSTSVEVALKLAFQYFKNVGRPRKKFLSLNGSYHGDTLGAMSVSSRSSFHQDFGPLLFDVDFVDPEADLTHLEEHARDYAAFIVEPLIQGAGGMNIYSADFLKNIRSFCDRYEILLIFDEVFTGFGRLNDFFAFHKAQVTPDLICLSKGISGGFLPMGATVATENLFEIFLDKNIKKAFLHGHSYTGNPLAAAASITSINILKSDESRKKRAMISKVTHERLELMANNPRVHNPRSIGTIGAFDFKEKKNYGEDDFAYRFSKRCLDENILLRPLGNVIYTVPPFCSTKEDINTTYDIIEELLNEFE